MTVYGGIDLHSNNSYVGIVNEENQVIFKNRYRNDLPTILSALAPFKDDLRAIAIESKHSSELAPGSSYTACYR